MSRIDTEIESLQSQLELAKGITQLAESVNQAVVILAKAILESQSGNYIRPSTRQALESLAETETK